MSHCCTETLLSLVRIQPPWKLGWPEWALKALTWEILKFYSGLLSGNSISIFFQLMVGDFEATFNSISCRSSRSELGSVFDSLLRKCCWLILNDLLKIVKNKSDSLKKFSRAAALKTLSLDTKSDKSIHLAWLNFRWLLRELFIKTQFSVIFFKHLKNLLHHFFDLVRFLHSRNKSSSHVHNFEKLSLPCHPDWKMLS